MNGYMMVEAAPNVIALSLHQIAEQEHELPLPLIILEGVGVVDCDNTLVMVLISKHQDYM